MRKLIALLALFSHLNAFAATSIRNDTIEARQTLRSLGSLSVNGAVTLTGNVGAGGTLSVAGASTLTGAVGIGPSPSPGPDRILDVNSTTKSSAPFPTMSTSQRDAISTPRLGDFVVNSDTGQLNQHNGVAWGAVAGAGGSGGINYITNYDGSSTTGWNTYSQVQTATMTIAAPAVVTITSTVSFYVGMPVIFTTSGALPTGVTSGTTYFVSSVVSGTTFQISTTLGGSSLTTTGSQSGTHVARPYIPIGSQPGSYSGNAPNITWASSTSTPLRGPNSFLLTKDAAVRAGEYVGYNFTVDAADSTYQTKQIEITIDYRVSSGTYGYGTSITDSDLEIALLDPNGVLPAIQPSGFKIDGGMIRAVFQPLQSVSAYRLAFYVATNSASAWTMEIDNVQVGPKLSVPGAPVTDWASFTPIITHSTGGATNYTATGKWKHAGDTIQVTGTVTFSAASAAFTEFYASLPVGLSIDSTKLSSTVALVPVLGTAAAFDLGITPYAPGNVYFRGTSALTTVDIRFPVSAGSAPVTANTPSASSPFTFNAGDTITWQFFAPIVGWSSNTLVSDSASTAVVEATAINSSNTTTITTNTTLGFNSVVTDTNGGWASDKYTVKVPGMYRVSANAIYNVTAVTALSTIDTHLRKNGATDVTVLGRATIPSGATNFYQTTGTTDIYLVAGDNIDFFANKGGTLTCNLHNDPLFNRVSISLILGPSQIQPSESVYAVYTTATIDNNFATGTLRTVNFDTKVEDSHGAVTVGVNAWVFKAPAPGMYCFDARFQFDGSSGSWGAGNHINSMLRKNGSSMIYGRNDVAWVADTNNHGSETTGCRRLVTGDLIDFQTKHDQSSTTRKLINDNTQNVISIYRVGL